MFREQSIDLLMKVIADRAGGVDILMTLQTYVRPEHSHAQAARHTMDIVLDVLQARHEPDQASPTHAKFAAGTSRSMPLNVVGSGPHGPAARRRIKRLMGCP